MPNKHQKLQTNQLLLRLQQTWPSSALSPPFFESSGVLCAEVASLVRAAKEKFEDSKEEERGQRITLKQWKFWIFSLKLKGSLTNQRLRNLSIAFVMKMKGLLMRFKRQSGANNLEHQKIWTFAFREKLSFLWVHNSVYQKNVMIRSNKKKRNLVLPLYRCRKSGIYIIPPPILSSSQADMWMKVDLTNKHKHITPPEIWKLRSIDCLSRTPGKTGINWIRFSPPQHFQNHLYQMNKWLGH